MATAIVVTSAPINHVLIYRIVAPWGTGKHGSPRRIVSGCHKLLVTTSPNLNGKPRPTVRAPRIAGVKIGKRPVH